MAKEKTAAASELSLAEKVTRLERLVVRLLLGAKSAGFDISLVHFGERELEDQLALRMAVQKHYYGADAGSNPDAAEKAFARESLLSLLSPDIAQAQAQLDAATAKQLAAEKEAARRELRAKIDQAEAEKLAASEKLAKLNAEKIE